MADQLPSPVPPKAPTLDRYLPAFVGQRTEILTVLAAGAEIAGMLGGITPDQAHGIAGVLLTLAGGTFAARYTRTNPSS